MQTQISKQRKKFSSLNGLNLKCLTFKAQFLTLKQIAKNTHGKSLDTKNFKTNINTKYVKGYDVSLRYYIDCTTQSFNKCIS